MYCLPGYIQRWCCTVFVHVVQYVYMYCLHVLFTYSTWCCTCCTHNYVYMYCLQRWCCTCCTHMCTCIVSKCTYMMLYMLYTYVYMYCFQVYIHDVVHVVHICIHVLFTRVHTIHDVVHVVQYVYMCCLRVLCCLQGFLMKTAVIGMPMWDPFTQSYTHVYTGQSCVITRTCTVHVQGVHIHVCHTHLLWPIDVITSICGPNHPIIHVCSSCCNTR